MLTQRVHHTDRMLLSIQLRGTNAHTVVNCSLKNRRTRVESNKSEGRAITLSVKLTASNRVVGAGRLGQILILQFAVTQSP